MFSWGKSARFRFSPRVWYGPCYQVGMASITMKESGLRLEFAPAKGHTLHGGQVAVAAMCKKLGLWTLLRGERDLDTRKDRTRGFAPEVMAAQLVVSFCCGGAGLVDAARLQNEKGLKRVLGVHRLAGETQLGEWLRELGEPGVEALRRVARRLVAKALALCPSGTVRTGGELEVFFDDTQLEVTGRKIEGAARNYNGDRALGWQCLFVGPFLADQKLLGDNAAVSKALPEFLEANTELWGETPRYLFADSASSAGEYLGCIARAFPAYSVSYNRWTGPLERAAEALPASTWQGTTEEAFAYVRHQPAGCAAPQVFAVRRYQAADELMPRYAFFACEDGSRKARAVRDRHNLKGERERMFSQLLTDLDLHHPPCLSLVANQAFYALGAIAYNVLVALKLLELPVACHRWSLRRLIRHLLCVPAKLSRHARGLVLRLFCPLDWLDWWHRWQATHAPA